MARSEVNVWVPGAAGHVYRQRRWTAVRSTRAIKGNAALWVVISRVSLVKGSIGLMVGRSISVDWLSTLFPLVTFPAKYRHFHNYGPLFQKSFVNLASQTSISKLK